MMALPYVMMFAMRPGKLRVVAAVMVPALIMAMLKTASRGGMASFLALFVATIIVSQKRQRKTYFILLGVAVITMALAPHAGLMERISALISGNDYNFEAKGGRIEVWKHGLVLMATHPILGVGFGAYQWANAATVGLYATAHNAYIQLGAELGFGGSILFFTAIVSAFKCGWWARRHSAAEEMVGGKRIESFERALATASLISLVAHLVSCVFLSMAYDAMTLLVLAVPTSLAMGMSTRQGVPARDVRPGVSRGRLGARQPMRRGAPVRGAPPVRGVASGRASV